MKVIEKPIAWISLYRDANDGDYQWECYMTEREARTMASHGSPIIPPYAKIAVPYLTDAGSDLLLAQ